MRSRGHAEKPEGTAPEKETLAPPQTKSHVRKTVFQPRTSPLDYETLHRERNTMRGFFVLFWMIMVVYFLLTMLHNYRTQGSLIGWKLANVFTKDLLTLAVSDFVMALSTYYCVFFMKFVLTRWISLSFATVIKHLWQTTWFSVVIAYSIYKDWPWVQTASFVMHSITLLMKMHSYCTYNMELIDKSDKLKEITSTLQGNNISQTEEDRLKQEAGDIERELTKPTLSFPNNVTFFNYTDFLFLPTLVYELEYPRIPKFRPLYFLSKVFALASSFVLMYVTVEHYIHPVMDRMSEETFLESLLQLIPPFTVMHLMGFFIIFECILNAAAEMTLFADRQFYEDFWNSETYDDFARRWNKPVHEFLLRHVYLKSIDTYKFSKQRATLLTFLLSALLHELVLVIVGKRVRFYLFGFQMLQVPIIYVSRLIALRRYPLAGNIFFWFGMLVGPPMINYLYCREAYLSTS